MAALPARSTRSTRASPSATTWRSRIPVRVVIQSSEVSDHLLEIGVGQHLFGQKPPQPGDTGGG
jgi:hypothetical protein